jgi:AraC-like DNA-binding protein
MINIFQTLKNYPGISKQLTCKDLLFTNYDCPQTDKKQGFFIECNVIVYVISGRRIFQKKKQSWELNEGVCVFIKKGAHFAIREKEDDWCVMAFFMPDHFLQQLVRENRNSLPLVQLPEAGEDHVLALDVNALSQSFFNSMPPYFTQDPPPPENLLELKFKELILSLLSNPKNDHLLSYLHNLSQGKNPSLEEVMQNNFSFKLSLAEYAKLTCKSVPTFKREFKRVFKDSPAKWVVKKRLSLAAEMLENTALPIGEITYECGFENQTHFSRTFKEKFGLTPSRYRMENQSSS